MSKSIKLKNNTYIDSKGVAHNKQTLYNILHTSNINLTFNSQYVYDTDLDYNCLKIGNIVILSINTMGFKTNNIENYGVIASGLPKPTATHRFHLFPNNGTANSFRVHIDTDGRIKRHWTSDPIYGDSANKQYNGCLVYLTNE